MRKNNFVVNLVKEIDHFKYLGSVLTRDGYCTREIKMRLAIAKEAFNRKILFLTSKLTFNSRRNWICVLFGALLYMAQRPGH